MTRTFTPPSHALFGWIYFALTQQDLQNTAKAKCFSFLPSYFVPCNNSSDHRHAHSTLWVPACCPCRPPFHPSIPIQSATCAIGSNWIDYVFPGGGSFLPSSRTLFVWMLNTHNYLQKYRVGTWLNYKPKRAPFIILTPPNQQPVQIHIRCLYKYLWTAYVAGYTWSKSS